MNVKDLKNKKLKDFLKKHHKILIGYFLIAILVLLWTRLDWIIHIDSYLLPGGFKPTLEWLVNYWSTYFLQYFALVFVFFFISQSWKHTVPLAVFFASAGPDLIFFGWGGFVFPSGEWDWMLWYCVFGSWTTFMQFIWTIGLTTIAVLVIRFYPRKIN